MKRRPARNPVSTATSAAVPWFTPVALWSQLLASQARMLASSSTVFTYRIARWADPGLSDAVRRREWAHAATEKWMAAAQGWQAMSWAALQAQQSLWVRVVSPDPRRARFGNAALAAAATTGARIAARGVAPISGKVTRNARNLARRRNKV